MQSSPVFALLTFIPLEIAFLDIILKAFCEQMAGHFLMARPLMSVGRYSLLVIYDASRMYVCTHYGSLYRLNKEASTTQTLGVCASLDIGLPSKAKSERKTEKG